MPSSRTASDTAHAHRIAAAGSASLNGRSGSGRSRWNVTDLVVHDDACRQVAGGRVQLAGPDAHDRTVEPREGAIQRDGSLQAVPEVHGEHGIPGRVPTDPLTQWEPVGPPVGRLLGKGRRQVRDERIAVRSSDLLVGQEPVVRDREELPGCRVVPGRVERGGRRNGGGYGQRPTDVLGGRCPDGQPQTIAIGHERRRLATHRDRRLDDACVWVDRTDRAIELVRDPQRVCRGRERVRAVPDGEQVLRLSGGGVETGDGAVEVVRHPDRPERGEHGRRSVADGLIGERHAQVGVRRVDARDACGRDRHPHPARRERHAGGLTGKRDGPDLARVRIQPNKPYADRVGDPQRAVRRRRSRLAWSRPRSTWWSGRSRGRSG